MAHRLTTLLAPWALVVATWCPVAIGPAQGSEREDRIVRESTLVLREVMAIPLRQIPASLLADAEGLAIVPNVIKGSFVVGARHGNGVLLIRDEAGRWQAPVFISLTGGNVGWQIGVQSTDVVLVFRTADSVQNLLSGKFTIGADAAAAAGPVGRNVAAATDVRLAAEILSYSRSRGLFAGISLDGSVISVDEWATDAYYPFRPGGPAPVVPPAAVSLVQQVMAISDETTPASELAAPAPSVPTTGFVARNPVAAPDRAADQLGTLRQQTERLFARLDPAWQAYFGVPREVLAGEMPRDMQAMYRCGQRFETVRQDARYRGLTDRPEFQDAYGAWRTYLDTVAGNAATLQLPPPPPESP